MPGSVPGVRGVTCISCGYCENTYSQMTDTQADVIHEFNASWKKFPQETKIPSHLETADVKNADFTSKDAVVMVSVWALCPFKGDPAPLGFPPLTLENQVWLNNLRRGQRHPTGPQDMTRLSFWSHQVRTIWKGSKLTISLHVFTVIIIIIATFPIYQMSSNRVERRRKLLCKTGLRNGNWEILLWCVVSCEREWELDSGQE